MLPKTKVLLLSIPLFLSPCVASSTRNFWMIPSRPARVTPTVRISTTLMARVRLVGANDTNGGGFVSHAMPWSRALNFSPNYVSLEIEEAAAVEAIWRGRRCGNCPSGGVFANPGISDGNLNSGNNIPALRVDISLGGDGSIRFGTSSDLRLCRSCRCIHWSKHPYKLV